MAIELFQDSFKAGPTASGFTPGRVNLIGEHTDYNGGWVLPTALELGLTISVSARNDAVIRIASQGYDDIVTGELHDAAKDHWSDYVIGSVNYANQYGLTQGGADIAIESTLPQGAGLSSSAAVTVGLLKRFQEISGTEFTDSKIAQIAREIENDFIGVPCGIMDQMAVAIASPGQAMQLDTDTLQYDVIPIPETVKMIVIHSGQYRQLSEGRYKIRKEECDVIKDKLGRQDICQIDNKDFAQLHELPLHIQRRAKHCMTEHRRTVSASASLRTGNMVEFGRLMTESHVSMRDDFENSLPPIDRLVDDAVKKGAYGARMTGGGFGGCIVACVKADDAESWIKNLLQDHSGAFYVC